MTQQMVDVVDAYKILGLESTPPYSEWIQGAKSIGVPDSVDADYHFIKLLEDIYHKIRNPTDSDAVKRFRELKEALLLLNPASEYKNCTLEDLFKVFASEQVEEAGCSDEEYSFEDEENDRPHLPPLTAEEISKNARELIEEEEKEKRKAEKKKASKKRRKQKKKNEKMDSKEKVASSQPAEPPKSQNHLVSSDHEEDIDPNSAFVANIAKSKTRKKANGIQPLGGGGSAAKSLLPSRQAAGPGKGGQANNISSPSHTSNNNNKSSNTTHKSNNKSSNSNNKSKSNSNNKSNNKDGEDQEEDEEVDDMKHESYRLNELGKTLALEERFQEAISHFTQAIELNPTQPSFLDNRSYCYTSLQKYKRALKDAKKAVELDYLRPQGYFRMGQAYLGMKDYVKSEEAFLKVLELEPSCQDAHQELYSIKMLQLIDMGITAEQARAALDHNSTVEQATEWIYEGNCPNIAPVDEEEVYISEEETEVVERRAAPPAAASQRPAPPSSTSAPAVDIKMDPRNPERSSTLWVGNIGADLQEKALYNLFSKYGTVHSYKVVKDPVKNRNYAFINFRDPESASNAMKALQDKYFGGHNLRLRFPDNTKGNKNNSDNKKQGPIITQYGPECRHFRQGHCTYGQKCIFKHIPSHEGIDKSKH